MYERLPTDEELEGSGFTRADYETDPVEVWAENVPAYLLFDMLSTQWRVGLDGRTGLDYNVAFHKMDRMRLSPEEYEDLELDLRILENAALKEMRRKP